MIIIDQRVKNAFVFREHKEWKLHISNIQESDRGWYMCQVDFILHFPQDISQLTSCILYPVSCILYFMFRNFNSVSHVSCILSRAYWILYSVSYILYFMFRIFNSVSHVSCILSPAYWILYSVSYILYPESCIMYSVSCILYYVPCLMNPVSCVLNPVLCILYSISCIMFLA